MKSLVCLLGRHIPILSKSNPQGASKSPGRSRLLHHRPRYYQHATRSHAIRSFNVSTVKITFFLWILDLSSTVPSRNSGSGPVMVASYLSLSYLISASILSNLGAHLISYFIYGCGLVSSSRTFWYVPLHSDVIDDIT